MSIHKSHPSFAAAHVSAALRLMALAAVAVGGAAIATAQSQSTPAAQPAETTFGAQAPLDLSSAAPLFSTSAGQSTTQEASLVVAPKTDFAAMMQYGGGQRRSYGRPRYRGNNTTADGTPKYTGMVGAGLSQPVGNTWHYLTPSYGFQAGFGRNFDRHVAVLAQFDYDHFGFTGATLTNQTTLLNNPNVFAGQISGLDGSSHVWSFTLDPTFTLSAHEGFGSYVVAGVGFYHKTANFTVPAQATGYSPYYGYYTYTANETVDKYTSNAPGFNAGLGLTYKFSRFSNERFYVEARYVFVDNSHRAGITVNNQNQLTATSTNLYPANSNRTTYFPIKAGIRF